MKPYGGFDHNAQTLRIVTRLEHRYANFDGLNLTWETLEGLVKHNGPLIDAEGHALGHYREFRDCRRPSSNMPRCMTSNLLHGHRPKRRSQPLPTTLPTMHMTLTTACARICST